LLSYITCRLVASVLSHFEIILNSGQPSPLLKKYKKSNPSGSCVGNWLSS